MEMNSTHRYTDLTLYRRLLRLALPYWPHIAGLFLLNLLSSSLGLLNPVPLKIVVDSVLDSHPLPGFVDAVTPSALKSSDTALLFLATGLLLGISVLGKLQGLASSVLNLYTGERLVLNFQAQLFRHAQRLSLSYHDSMGTADATYRIKYDATAIRS